MQLRIWKNEVLTFYYRTAIIFIYLRSSLELIIMFKKVSVFDFTEGSPAVGKYRTVFPNGVSRCLKLGPMNHTEIKF